MERQVGDTVHYVVTLTNSGASDETVAEVVDDYDQAHIAPSNISDAGVDDGDRIVWMSVMVGPGSSQTLTYDATVIGTFSGSPDPGCPYPWQHPVFNTASTGSISATAFLCVAPRADFDVEKSVDPPVAAVGDVVTYTVKVTNIGSGSGQAKVDDDYDQTHIAPFNISNNGNDDGDQIHWTTKTLDPGESISLTYDATVIGTFSATPGDGCDPGMFPVHNVARVPHDEDDATLCVIAEPDFDVVKSVDPPIAEIGDTVHYAITVTNNGVGPGSTPVVDDYDQAHIAPFNISDSGTDDGDTITWDSGALDPGDSVTFGYDATVGGKFFGTPDAGCGPGEFPVVNKVTVEGDEAEAMLCVTPNPAFDVDKSVDPTEAAVGDTVTYTVTVTNIGTGPGSTPVEDDYDQDHIAPFDISGGGTDDGDTITWDSGTLDPEQSATFTYQATVEGTFSGTPGPGCDEENEFPVLNSVTVDGAADEALLCVQTDDVFDVEKSVDPTEAAVGDTVTYTVTVTNIGTGPGSTPVEDDYDQDHIAPFDISDDGDTITWDSGVLDPGQSVVFTYQATVEGPFTGPPGPGCDEPNEFPVLNSVTVEDDSAEATLCVTAMPQSELVKLVRNVSDGGEFAESASGDPGETIEFQITYSNTGDADATNVTITDQVPEHTTFAACDPLLTCSEDGGTVTWTVGTVPAGGGAVVSFTVTLNEDFQPGITFIDNEAMVTTDQEPFGILSNEVVVTVVLLEKTDCTTNPVPGGSITYTITFGSFGADAHGVVLTDELPSKVLFDGASPAPTTAPPAGESGTITWELGTVPDGTTVVVTVHGTISPDADEGDVLVNTAILEAEGVPAQATTHEVTVALDGEATSRAYGIALDTPLLDLEPTPDSDVTNPDEVLHVPALPLADVSVLHVSEGSEFDSSGASSNAIATTAAVKLVDQGGGDWLVTADAVRAVSSSFADIGNAGSSSAGSTLLNVTVDGQNLGTVTETVSRTVNTPLSTASVKLLEKIPSGAAAGVEQPDGGMFHSDLTVNAIHVTITTAAATWSLTSSSPTPTAPHRSSAVWRAARCCRRCREPASRSA